MDVKRIENSIEFIIRGNAFLHNMIRIIIGTLIEMNKEMKPPNYINHVFEQKDRDIGGFTAPACGLYLENVIYEPALETMESAFS